MHSGVSSCDARDKRSLQHHGTNQRALLSCVHTYFKLNDDPTATCLIFPVCKTPAKILGIFEGSIFSIESTRSLFRIFYFEIFHTRHSITSSTKRNGWLAFKTHSTNSWSLRFRSRWNKAQLKFDGSRIFTRIFTDTQMTIQKWGYTGQYTK